MALGETSFDRHIKVLEEFEREYGEFLRARRHPPEGEMRWSQREWDERAHHLRALAPRAEAAMDASGLGSYEKLWPMALGGGVMSDDLSELIFDFSSGGFSVEAIDDELQWKILERVPSQIEGLRMRAEEAAAETKPKSRNQVPGGRLSAIWHEPNPWILGFAVTVVGGVVVGVILAVILSN